MKVIITDHHEVPYTGNGVPNAYAVCNPKQIDCEYEFKGLCGAGVALIGCVIPGQCLPNNALNNEAKNQAAH